MTTTRSTTTCGSCGEAIDEALDTGDTRRPCVACGSTARVFGVQIDEAITLRSGFGFKQKRLGHKRPIAEGFSRPETFRRTGAAVERSIRINRENDRYTETVTEYDTGVVIHHCDEKLSEHTGHGSAKKPRAT
jgi:hypothetical protein